MTSLELVDCFLPVLRQENRFLHAHSLGGTVSQIRPTSFAIQYAFLLYSYFFEIKFLTTKYYLAR